MGVLDSKRNRALDLFLELAVDLVGCFIFSVAMQCFSAPNSIAPGGVTGLSILINHVFGIPISLLSLFLNIPLLLLAWRLLGHAFTLRTLKTVAILTLTLAVCENYLPVYTGNEILAALFGGVLEGIGLGLVFMKGSTTGGTDVASRMLQLKFPYMPVGKLMLVVDGAVLVLSAFVFRSIESALYGLIAIFTATRLIDSMLYGLDTGRVMLVMSTRYRQIARKVTVQLSRGCTLLAGEGAYTGEEKAVLLCAVRKNQYSELKRLVHDIDPAAFLMVLEASEIVGEGFKPLDNK